MNRAPIDYLPGTLETLILKTLVRGPMHGYGIARWIEDATDPGVWKRGWIDAEWGTSELGRRAKFYRLTRQGRQQVIEDTKAWTVFAQAVNKVMVGG